MRTINARRIIGRLLRCVASLLFVLVPLMCAAATHVRHYSYSGNDPSRWTSSPLPGYEAAAPTDFTVYPCRASNCTIARVITDANRNTYVVGTTDLQTQGLMTGATADLFIAKLDPAGATLFLVTLGGKDYDSGRAIALDPAGNIVVGGLTRSLDFPLRNAIQTRPGSTSTGFVVKLSPDGSQLIFSTYFGGTTNMSSVSAVAIDGTSNAWVTGQTGSRDFSTTPGMPAGVVTGWGPAGILGAFIAKLSPAGDKVLSSGIVSGNAVACSGGSSCFLSIRVTTCDSIALDSTGNAYVAGNSGVTDLPTTEGALARRGLGGWAARINATGTNLDYLTYLGTGTTGSTSYVVATTGVNALAVDAQGNAYVAGVTSDPKFPATSGASQPVFNGPANPPPLITPPSDAYVAKLNPQGTAMLYATFLGGSDKDAATAITLDSAGSAYVTGTTESSDFPVTSVSKGRDFIAVLNPAGSSLRFSSRYPDGSISHTISVNGDGRIRAASWTGIITSLTLANAPSTRVFEITHGSGDLPDPVVAPGAVVSLFGTQLGPTNGAIAEADSTGKLPTALAGTQVLFDGVAGPLLYVSQDQINVVTPFGLSPGKETVIRVIAGTARSPEFRSFVSPSRPAIFGGPNGAAAINQDGTINSQSNPAKLGSVVAIWATGIGLISPTPSDGQVAKVSQDYHCCELYISGKPAEVLYSGAAPGIVAGVVQINFRVPTDLGGGTGQQVPISIAVHPTPPNLPAPASTGIFVSP